MDLLRSDRGRRETPAAAQESERARLARDAYSCLHLPLVGGVGFFAFGAREALDGIADPLPLLPAVALSGGVGKFYAADVAYRWRGHHQLARDRLLVSAASLLVIPLSMTMPAWSAVAVLRNSTADNSAAHGSRPNSARDVSCRRPTPLRDGAACTQ